MKSSGKSLSPLEAVTALYGPLPPQKSVATRVIHEVSRPDHHLQLLEISLGTNPQLCWTLFIATPTHKKLDQILLSSDGCWPHYLNDQVIKLVTDHGYTFAWFNRLELAHDSSTKSRSGKVFDAWPDTPWSAISIWAWAFHRTIDALLEHNKSDSVKVSIIGHSRSGKAALVASALDARIQVTISNNSGTGGAASLLSHEPGSESLQDLIREFPHWLSPDALLERNRDLLIDQDISYHWIKAIAPRGLMLRQAKGDAWGNPQGTFEMWQNVKGFWDEEKSIQLVMRDGEHPMTHVDWKDSLDFLTKYPGGSVVN